MDHGCIVAQDIVNSVVVSETDANHVTVTAATFIAEAGAASSLFYGVTSPPSSAVGAEGSFYIDLVGGNLWGPKGASEWPAEPTTLVPRRFVHNQNVSSSSWTISHDLGGFPSVTVVDSANNIVIGDVVYVDQSTVQVSFNGSFSGKAYLT